MGFAQEKVENRKKTHNTPLVASGYLENEYSQAQKKQFRMK